MPRPRSRLHWLLALLFSISPASSLRAGQAPSHPVQSHPVPSHPVQPAPAATVVENPGQGTLSLDGPWQFHLGDNPAWSSPATDDSQWEQLTAVQPWSTQGHANYTGFAWYRLHLAFAPDVPSSSATARQFSLLLPDIDDAYELYLNGQLVGSVGKLPPNPVWYYSHPAQIFGLGPVPSGTQANAQTSVLALRVWKAPLLSDDSDLTGGFEAPPLLGEHEAIAAAKAVLDYQWLRSHQFVYSVNLIYSLVALLGLLAWWRQRNQPILLWMTGYCLAPLLAVFLLNSYLRQPYTIAMSLAQPLASIRDISLWFLLLWLLRLHESRILMRITRALAIISLAASVADGLLIAMISTAHSLWFPQGQWIGFDAAVTVISTVAEAYPLALVALAVARRHRRLDSARWLVAFFAFLSEMIVVAQEALKQGRQVTHSTFALRMEEPIFSLAGSPVTIYAAASALLLISIVYAVFRNSMEVHRRQSAFEQEFRAARELQQVLIPARLPSLPGYALTSAYHPALEVGGDFFQIIPTEADAAVLILGDVSGKGLKAAMAVSLIVGMVRALIHRGLSAAQLLGELNVLLCGRLQGGFATCVVLLLHSDGNCTLASAGHPPPYRNDTEVAVEGALPLGLFPSVVYSETAIHMEPGDRLAFYTDGLLEARNSSGELYGFERLRHLFVGKPDAAQAAAAALDFGQDDDITVVMLTRV